MVKLLFIFFIISNNSFSINIENESRNEMSVDERIDILNNMLKIIENAHNNITTRRVEKEFLEAYEISEVKFYELNDSLIENKFSLDLQFNSLKATKSAQRKLEELKNCITSSKDLDGVFMKEYLLLCGYANDILALRYKYAVSPIEFCRDRKNIDRLLEYKALIDEQIGYMKKAFSEKIPLN